MKPVNLFIDNLTQEQKNSYVYCANLAGLKLVEWVTQVLDREVAQELEEYQWLLPLSAQAARYLAGAGYNSKAQVYDDFKTKPMFYWSGLRGYSHKVFEELSTWLKV